MHILLNWILQGIAVAGAAAAGLRLLRGGPAATRTRVCWAALLSILSLPLVPSLWAFASALASAPPPAFAVEPHGAVLAPVTPVTPLVRLPAMFSTTSVLLGAAWALWTAVQSVRVTRDVRWLRRARRRCRPLPAAVAARFSSETRRLLADTKARVVLCDEVRAAAVLGGGRPLIGLRLSLVEALSDHELDAVLVHELAHVVRRDARATLVQCAVEALAGWHPAVWWVMRRLALEREMACDEAALAVAGGPKDYARCLTRIAELTQGAPSPGLALAMLPASGLRRRILHILRPGSLSRRVAGVASGTLATGLTVLAVTTGSIVVFGEPAMADSVATFGAVTSALVQPLRGVAPAAIIEGLSSAAPAVPCIAARPQGGCSATAAVTVTVAVARARAETPAQAAPAPVAGNPRARPAAPAGIPPDALSATTLPGTAQLETALPGAPLPATVALPSAVLPGAVLPGAVLPPPVPVATSVGRPERPVTEAAVATAATTVDAWTAVTETGVVVGRISQQGAVATAGAFARWSRRIASSF